MTSEAPAEQPAAVRVLGRVPVHPVLLAIWPALTLWAANVDEVLPAEVWPTVWRPLLAAGLLWLATGLLLRSAARGALVTTATAAIVLNAGRIDPEPGRLAIIGSAMVFVGALLLAWKLPRRATPPLTTLLNVLAVTLVLLTAPPLLSTWGPGAAATTGGSPDGDAGGVATRDIFYIIPDRYPRQDTLTEVFDYDNEPFISFLESKGFQVADASLANYPKTAHSLAATWNLTTLDELIPDPPADGSDWGPLYARLRDHRLGHIVTGAGYEYIHMGTWWSPTSTAETADRVLRVDTDTEFSTVWESLTLLPALSRATSDETDIGDLPLRDRNRRHSAFQLDELDRLALERSRTPRFVLAHITLPHGPHVFAADGSFVTTEQELSRTREENLTGQLTYLNTRLERLVTTLTSGPPETWPVIVIQSDEGPHPAARTGPEYDWTTAPDVVLEEKLRTFSAILLPQSDVVLPEDLTGIDTWRRVLDATIGTDFGPHPDPPIDVFPGESHLYEFVDVSDRIR